MVDETPLINFQLKISSTWQDDSIIPQEFYVTSKAACSRGWLCHVPPLCRLSSREDSKSNEMLRIYICTSMPS